MLIHKMYGYNIRVTFITIVGVLDAHCGFALAIIVRFTMIVGVV